MTSEQAGARDSGAFRDTPLQADQLATLAAEVAKALAPVVTAALVAPRPPLLDATGAAALLDVPKSWVLAEARAGRLPHRRLGKYVRFDAAALLAWVDEQPGTGAGPVTAEPVAPVEAGGLPQIGTRGTTPGTRRAA